MIRSLASLPRQFVFAIIGFWIMYSSLVFGIGWASSVFRDRVFSLPSTLVWNAGWLLWAIETFMVILIARALPFDRSQPWRRLGAHALVGLGVAMGHVLLESLLIRGLKPMFPSIEQSQMGLAPLFFYKFHIFYLIYWAIVGATNAFDYYQRFRDTDLRSSRLDAELAKWQLQALKSQLQPHFLFNTHHSIIGLMLKGKTDTAIRMLTGLSDLLRLTLEKPERQTVPLREELAALRLYIRIQEQRFSDRLRFTVEAPQELLDCQVPYLLLQPLVENAITHGIDDEEGGIGEIAITCALKHGALELRVSDPGRQTPISPMARERHGLGLENTRSRLSGLYGEASKLELTTRNTGGSDAIVTIPYPVSDRPNGDVTAS